MRRQIRFGLIVAIALTTLACSQVRGELISLLLSPPNATNDALQDRSWRVELANAGGWGAIGNVMYGLSAFDTLTVNGMNYNLDRSVWMVFSVTRSAVATRTFLGPLGPFQLTGHDFSATTLSGYTLGSLLGIPSLPASAMAAIVELVVPYSSTTFLRQLINDLPASKTLIDNAVGELASNARLIAAFGVVDPQDFYFMRLPSGDGTQVGLEFFGLSPVAVGPSVDINWFRPLYTEVSQRTDLSQFEFSLRDFMNVTLQQIAPEPGVLALYTDRGTVVVNVVPEPSAWVVLLGLGSAGYLLRRRLRRPTLASCPAK